jgi:Ca2+-binding RTX toxin-like protein
VRSAFEFIMSRRRDGDGRRGAIVLAAALAVFLAALMFSLSSAYGAPEAKAPPTKAAKKKPKVEASIRRGQLNVLGTAKSERIALRLKPGNKSRLQVDVGANGFAEFTFNRSAFNRIAVHGASGADALSINESFGVFANTEATSLFGDTGNDLLRGGSTAERLFGGIGNDTIDGRRGNDLIEGGAGSDLVVFNGSNAAEKFEFSANGNRLRFTAAGTMNIAGVERFDLRALGGADNVVVNDLSGAGLGQLNADLANDGAADVVDVKGSSAANELRVGGAFNIRGIGAAVNVLRAQAANDKLNLDPGAGSDRVIVEGTFGNDTIRVAPAAVAPHIAVSGGPAGLPIDVVNAEALAVESLAGNDTLNGAIGLAALTQLSLDGGAGNDAINGGDGAEVLLGGHGDDAIDGNGGGDVGLLGAGDDSFRWDPGDGSDVVEGQDGIDTLRFNGAGAAENFDVSANGERVKFSRDVANITMDLNDTERIDTQALGGADNAVLNDVSGTDLKLVAFDLEAAIGGGAGDGAADSVTVNGTNLPDDIPITAIGSVVDVDGGSAEVQIDHSEAANDKLTVNGLGGADTITGGPGLAALIQLVINGGPDADVLTGGDGNDRIVGQQQNDSMFGGAGNDTLVWNPGDANDLVEGQAGNDSMEFIGSGGKESFEASAVAGRLRFTRDVGNIVMDVDDTERVDLRGLGGADVTVVNDLTGTDVTKADIDLADVTGGGAGDAAADAIIVNGINGPDNVTVAANGGVVDVTGLFTAIGISHSEVANDSLAINGLGGDDDVVIGRGVAALIQTLVDLGGDE